MGKGLHKGVGTRRWGSLTGSHLGGCLSQRALQTPGVGNVPGGGHSRCEGSRVDLCSMSSGDGTGATVARVKHDWQETRSERSGGGLKTEPVGRHETQTGFWFGTQLDRRCWEEEQ